MNKLCNPVVQIIKLSLGINVHEMVGRLNCVTSGHLLVNVLFVPVQFQLRECTKDTFRNDIIVQSYT